MSNLTLGGALEQPCEKHHNVEYITLGGALEALEQPWKIHFPKTGAPARVRSPEDGARAKCDAHHAAAA